MKLAEMTVPGGIALKASSETRTIEGVIVTGEDFQSPETGETVRFLPNSVTPWRDHVPLCYQHDITNPLGKMTLSEWDSDGNLGGKFKVSEVPDADNKLKLAADGTLGGLSAFVKDVEIDDQGNITAAKLVEVSLVTHPHLSGALISSVALSSATTTVAAPAPPKETEMTDNTTVADNTMELSAPVPQPVPLIGATEIENPYPHLFGGTTGKPEYSFFKDLRLAASDGSARDRLTQFRLAVTTDGLPPRDPATRQTVDYRDPDNPLSGYISTDSIADDTPFYVLAYDGSDEADLINPHVEGVEPVLGELGTWGRSLVTPTAVSGKIAITREAFESTTTPKSEAQAFARFEVARKRALEVALGASLDALTLPAGQIYSIAGANPVGLTTTAILGTQATVHADRYNAALFSRAAFSALVNQVDTTGRPLLAPVSPSNAPGTTARGYTSVDINGVQARGVSGITNSYLIDSSVVWQYTSAVLNFSFDYEIAWVRLGTFQFQASKVTDLGGIVRLTR